mmetsp:Transcript_61763/g.145576  ORF Transcript_61763/g.145576 Transcript_61763/m.145576 type:complete len:255 (-) Transcript_61763:753-1517(-)
MRYRSRSNTLVPEELFVLLLLLSLLPLLLLTLVFVSASSLFFFFFFFFLLPLPSDPAACASGCSAVGAGSPHSSHSAAVSSCIRFSFSKCCRFTLRSRFGSTRRNTSQECLCSTTLTASSAAFFAPSLFFPISLLKLSANAFSFSTTACALARSPPTLAHRSRSDTNPFASASFASAGSNGSRCCPPIFGRVPHPASSSASLLFACHRSQLITGGAGSGCTSWPSISRHRATHLLRKASTLTLRLGWRRGLSAS